jgi:hypothetical protein
MTIADRIELEIYRHANLAGDDEDVRKCAEAITEMLIKIGLLNERDREDKGGD